MILLTGATGFVGSVIHRLLTERAAERVVALGRRQAPDITICDLLNPQQSEVPWGQIETVIHCAAAIPSVSKGDPFDNARMSQELLKRLSPGRLKAFVLLSSVAVYPLAASQSEVLLEEECATLPLDAYGRSKVIQEWLVSDLGRDRFPVAILRPSSVYGAGNTSRTLLPIFVERARAGEPLTLKGSRKYTQNFVHVDDVASAAVTAALGGLAGTYNIFSDETLSPRQLAERIVKYYGSSSPIIDEQDDAACPRLLFDKQRYIRQFKCVPLTLEQGLARI